MGRILFVTVGTSAINNRELWERNGDLGPCLPPDGNWGELVNAAESECLKELQHHRGHVDWAKVEHRVRTQWTEFEKALTDLHRRFWAKSDHYRRKNPKSTSAEAISTWLAGEDNRLDRGPLEAGEDKAVLLVSKTCIGQMAGRVNETLFREFHFRGGGEPEVVIEPIDDLRLHGIRDEQGAGESLSRQVRGIYARHTRNDKHTPIFNITGGFKGLIPVITMICAEPPGRTMLYQHESMLSAVQLRFENGEIQEEEFDERHVNH